jgi:hypothetical protein
MINAQITQQQSIEDSVFGGITHHFCISILDFPERFKEVANLQNQSYLT